MKSRLNQVLVLGILGMVVGCSSPEQKDAQSESGASSKLDKLPITDIPFDPTKFADEWITALLLDNFSDELELETFMEFEAPDGRRQYFIVGNGYEGPSYYQLIENGPEQHTYTLSVVGNTDGSVALKHRQTAGIDFFSLKELHFMEDDVSELIVGADISGTYHNDEGTMPYRMVVFDVLHRDNEGFAVETESTLLFNSEQNIEVEDYTNDPLPVFLAKKYHDNSHPATDEEKRGLIHGLMEDMGIVDFNDEGFNHEFGTVTWKDDHYVIDLSWLNSGYYFIPERHYPHYNGSANSDDFPLLYITDREVDEWKILEASVTPDSIVFEFQNLESGSDEQLNGVFTMDEKHRWQFRFDGYTYMMKKDSEGFEVVGHELDQ